MPTLTTCGIPHAIEQELRTRLANSTLRTVVVGCGSLSTGAFLETSQESWHATIAAVRAAFQHAQAAAAELVDAHLPGRIVVLVPTPCLRPVHNTSLLATAGGFLTTIAQVGAAELGASGITVNVVVHGWLAGAPDAVVDGIPVGRLTTPGDIAAAVGFLSSEDASYVTGTVLSVDGGFWITKTPGGSPFGA